MKVCFIGNFSGGGTERVTLQLVNELVKDSEIEVILISTGKSILTFPCSTEISFINLPHLPLSHRIWGLRKALKKLKPDIVVSIEALSGIYTIPATLGLGVRNIVWEHANYYQTQNSRWIRSVRRLWLRYFADTYVVLTKRDLKNFSVNEKVRCQLSRFIIRLRRFKKHRSHIVPIAKL